MSDIRLLWKVLDPTSEKLKLNELSRRDITFVLKDFFTQKKSTASILRFLSSVKKLIDYQIQERLRKDDPLEFIERPKLWSKLPDVLSEEEIETLFKAIDVETPLGLRDRALFEIAYSLGLRVSEIVNLTMSAIHFNERVIRVHGKRDKMRLVPFPECTLNWLNRYIKEVRPHWAKKSKRVNTSVFLNRSGNPLTRQGVWKKLSQYGRTAGITKRLYPHILRHSIATHLLQRGAGLRTVQTFLGHSQASSTQIYTHVFPKEVYEVYKKHHPRA